MLSLILEKLADFWLIIDVSRAFNTFLGAILAFGFAGYTYKRQKKSEESAYLKFAVASFSTTVSFLLRIQKQQIVPRENELKSPKQAIDALAKKMPIPGDRHILDVEKLNFLAKYDPNVIMLINDALDSYAQLLQTIDQCNFYVDRCLEKCTQENIDMLFSCNKALIQQNMDTLYLAKLVADTLVEGCDKYYDSKNCKKFEVNDIYKEINIIPIDSYEGIEWWN